VKGGIGAGNCKCRSRLMSSLMSPGVAGWCTCASTHQWQKLCQDFFANPTAQPTVINNVCAWWHSIHDNVQAVGLELSR
jgi:hypothetical protein